MLPIHTEPCVGREEVGAPALLLMPCVLVMSACMNYFDTLLFIFFARDEGEIYKTTATLEDGGEAG